MADDELAASTRAELFALPVAEFVAARNELVRRLKADGDTDEAAVVAKLRRPTLAAWAVNQVVRDQADDFAELVTAGEQVQRAQRKALSGVRDSGLKEASSTRRELVERLTDRAQTVLAQAGARPQSHLDDVAATFEAATASRDVAEEVGAGCLSAPIRVETDFGGAGGLFAVPVHEEEQRDQDVDADDPAAEERRAAIRALEDAQARATASSTAAREAREQAAALAEEADRARRDADAAREAAERAEADATDVATRAEQAEAVAAEAAATAETDADAAEEARSALDDLA